MKYERTHWLIWRWDERYTDFAERRGWPEWAWFCGAWDWFHTAACWLFRRHSPERDQCNNPDHDFCIFCRKSMPGSWVQGAR